VVRTHGGGGLAARLASTSAIGFSWRSDLLLVASVGDTGFVAAAFASWRTGATARQGRWRPWRGREAGTQRRPASR
jgi:hypothetical protein